MRLVDTHAHLDHIDDLDGALDRAQETGIRKIITIGTTIAESENACNLALSCSRPHLRHPLRSKSFEDQEGFGGQAGLDIRTTGLDVCATCGIHPKDGRNDVKRFGIDESIHRLRTIAQSSEKVVAVGECGLDYYLDRDTKHGTGDKEKIFQRELFKAQIELAAELDLPIVIHCRNGWDEIFDLLAMNDKRSTISGVSHSWTGNWNDAKKALDLGFYISFSGIVTFRNASTVQDTARRMPLDRMLIETDSPFLAPEPHRGQKNEPKNVRIVAQFIADIRKSTLDEVAAQTSANVQELFKLL